MDLKYLNNVKTELECYNRFFPDSRFVKAIEDLYRARSFNTVIREGELFFRARIYRPHNDTEVKTDAFEGYGPKQSGVNPDSWCNEGRMNPAGITLMYVATGATTCTKEIGAATGEIVSIAHFKCKEDLHIADFQSIRVYDPEKKILVDWIRELLSRGYGGRDYVVTQFIAMLCQKNGYDGIKYRSKFATKDAVRKGNNIALFNFEKCECISSKLYKVNSISLGLTQLSS